ncbi:MAG: DoxX family protein [Rhodocyclaceae bacterium]|nr:DoxX family protein [Rhodocyclaceae bacterium]
MDMARMVATPAGRHRGASPRALRQLADRALGWLALGTPLVDLALRLVVGAVFFNSGLTKLASWDSTLALFENEYAVPLLPPELAAWLGTGVELLMPVLLVLGLGTRLAAAITFVFNVVAVLSYPDLSAAGLRDHQYWGLMLLVTLVHGPGRLSLDHLIRRRFAGGDA